MKSSRPKPRTKPMLEVMENGICAELSLVSTLVLAVEGLTLWRIPQIFEVEKKSFNFIGASQKHEVDAV